MKHEDAGPLLVHDDVFASDFDVHDWEDWLRVICWREVVEPDSTGGRTARVPAAVIVLPRSAVRRLIEALRLSVAPAPPRLHS